MNQFIKTLFLKAVVGFASLLVFCLHVYFVMILGAKPALAEDVSVSVQKAVNEKSLGAGSSKDITAHKKEKDQEETSIEVAKATEDEDSEEANLKGGLSIKINGEDGVSITGSKKLVDQLEALEKKIESKLENSVVYNNPDTAFYKALENVLVPTVAFLLIFGFAGYVVYNKHKTRQQLLETVRTLAQSGQAIPPELLSQLHNQPQWSLNSVNYTNPNATQGIKYLFIGFGVAGFLWLVDIGFVGSAIGFIFIAMGGYHLVKSHVLQKQIDLKKAETPSHEIKNTPASPVSSGETSAPPTVTL